MTAYRLFASKVGPPRATSYTGPFLPGVSFELTTGGTWFEGYWWWVCEKDQATSAQPFALWQVYDDGAGTLIAHSTLKSAALVAGRWNYVPLHAPLPLTIGVTDIAATGLRDSFPSTARFFGSSEACRAGIRKGPLRPTRTSPARDRRRLVSASAPSARTAPTRRNTCPPTASTPATTGWTCRLQTWRPRCLLPSLAQLPDSSEQGEHRYGPADYRNRVLAVGALPSRKDLVLQPTWSLGVAH